MLSFALWALASCNSSERVSVRAFEEKVERLRAGQTNRAETEALLSTAHVVESNSLTYYFADTEFGVGVRRYTPPSGLLPINPGAFPVIPGQDYVGFNDAGNLRQFAVERYFDPPFINDYADSARHTAKDTLDAVGQITAANGFKAIDINKENDSVNLQDN